MIKEKFKRCPRFPTSHSKKQQILTLSRFLLCAETIPELNRARRNSSFARQSENSYFVRDNSRTVPIPTLHRTYVL